MKMPYFVAFLVGFTELGRIIIPLGSTGFQKINESDLQLMHGCNSKPVPGPELGSQPQLALRHLDTVSFLSRIPFEKLLPFGKRR